MSTAAAHIETTASEEILLFGQVQGVGMRPAICRLARELGLTGDVRNQRGSVCVRATGDPSRLTLFIDALPHHLPGKARIDRIERCPGAAAAGPGFAITDNADGDEAHGLDSVAATADQGVCEACLNEVRDPLNRRFRYALNSCCECGPRYAMLDALPYERRNTSLTDFPMCPACLREYRDPADRRFHAQSVACHHCGPGVHLQRMDGRAFSMEALTSLDEVDAVASLIQQGEIVAIQGIGGFHLACDAMHADAVQRLRDRKGRPGKPLAMMARDASVIRQYARLSDAEQQLLSSAEAPIVLLRKLGESLPDEVAPGMSELGFMLPATPLHYLLFRRLDRPVVMTSGNRSGNPQCISVDAVQAELTDVADWVLWHDRGIVNRVDDSVVRVVEGRLQTLRCGRGDTPASISLPPGFDGAPAVLAVGGHLKNTVCLLEGNRAVLSPHIGDLDSPAMQAGHRSLIARLCGLYRFDAVRVATDSHPDYASTRMARDFAAHCAVDAVQHHHAHAAACLAENGRALDAGPVLAVVMDGIGLGDKGELWGGEFLRVDYASSCRVGSIMPAALPGAEAAMRQPWRNLYVQIRQAMGWASFSEKYQSLPVCQALQTMPLSTIEQMIERGSNSPVASSTGRLFDAVACALGLPDTALAQPLSYEGEAAMQLEAIAKTADAVAGYRFGITTVNGLPRLDSAPVWTLLFDDLAMGRAPADCAFAFHQGLADGIAAMLLHVHGEMTERVVALTGGVFQNGLLLGLTRRRLMEMDYTVLTHHRIPANDAGIALGQAVVSAARTLRGTS